MRLVLVSFLILFSFSPADPPRTIEIIGTDDMKYSVTTIRARPGEPLRLRLVSKGTLPRDRDGPQRRRAEGGYRRREVTRRRRPVPRHATSFRRR